MCVTNSLFGNISNFPGENEKYLQVFGEKCDTSLPYSLLSIDQSYQIYTSLFFRTHFICQQKDPLLTAIRLQSEADSGFVKLVVMTNVFFNNQQQEIKTKRFICVKQIKSSFFSNNSNQRFYLQYMQNVKIFSQNLVAQLPRQKFGGKEIL